MRLEVVDRETVNQAEQESGGASAGSRTSGLESNMLYGQFPAMLQIMSGMGLTSDGGLNQLHELIQAQQGKGVRYS